MVKKILLSEAFISNHFLERLSIRLPNSFYSNVENKRLFNQKLDYVRSIVFPKGSFSVNIWKLNKYYINGIIRNNDLITLFLREKLSLKDAWPVHDLSKFKSELDYIASDAFPSGSFFYPYVDEKTTYYFVVKDKNIIDVIGDVNIEQYSKYQMFTID